MSESKPPPMQPGKKRRFTDDFRRGAVELANEIGFRRAAEDLGVNQGNIRNWSKAIAETGDPSPKKTISDTERELAEAREEIRLLKRERELLKKAAAFFAKESE